MDQKQVINLQGLLLRCYWYVLLNDQCIYERTYAPTQHVICSDNFFLFMQVLQVQNSCSFSVM
jgi:hypothetical protein